MCCHYDILEYYQRWFELDKAVWSNAGQQAISVEMGKRGAEIVREMPSEQTNSGDDCAAISTWETQCAVEVSDGCLRQLRITLKLNQSGAYMSLSENGIVSDRPPQKYESLASVDKSFRSVDYSQTVSTMLTKNNQRTVVCGCLTLPPE